MDAAGVSVNEICHLLELRKRRSEAEFKIGYLLRKGREEKDPQVSMLEQELSSIAKQIGELEGKLRERKVEIFFPNEEKISDLSADLAKFRPEEVDRAMETKSGETYALLEERGKFLKENNKRRKDIAALVAFVNSLPSKIRDEVAERVRKGKMDDLDASTVDEKTRARLFRHLNRCGIACSLDGHNIVRAGKKGAAWNEVRVELGDDSYAWAEPGKQQDLLAFSREITQAGNAIQMMNAERQIRKFSHEEEARFEEAQKKYLELLRKKERLVSD